MRIIHIADLHLGYRAYNKLDSKGLNVREKDVIKAFQEALEKITLINPDLIIMAGDVFHKPRPSNFTIFTAINRLKKFRQSCNSPIIIISGNHETVKSTESGSVLSILESVIPRLKVVQGKAQEVVIDYLDTSIFCIPHEGLKDMEKTNIKPNKDYRYNILTIHGTYEDCPEIAGYGDGALIKGSEINQHNWNYIALGHYHKFTELAPNIYYSGAIERTTTNIWQEAKDDKGFIEYNLDTKKVEFHILNSPRKVIDVKKINAHELTAEEINLKIVQEVEKINNLDDSIVRITVENIDSVAIRGLDYKMIRHYKKAAVHFRLNLIRKDSVVNITASGEAVEKRKGIKESLDEELSNFELSQGLERERFSKLAKDYLEQALVPQ